MVICGMLYIVPLYNSVPFHFPYNNSKLYHYTICIDVPNVLNHQGILDRSDMQFLSLICMQSDQYKAIHNVTIIH